MRINTAEFQLYEVSRINRFIETYKYLTLRITEMLFNTVKWAQNF